MSDQNIYLHNSAHKDFIRNEWLRFASETLGKKDHLDVIMFPAEEMQELHFYAEKGLIGLVKKETGSYQVTKGKVVCFEKRQNIFMKLRTMLVGASVLQQDIGLYLRSQYSGLAAAKNNTFPVDVVNLDYDGRLSKNSVGIKDISEMIFKFQAIHKKHFSLFLTWPATENDDEEDYKQLLKATINDNLSDPRATNFKQFFSEKYESIDNLSYDSLSIIGVIKILISKAVNSNYSLNNNEFYIYGGKDNRQKMYSVLLNFIHEEEKAPHKIYTDTVMRSLHDFKDLNEILKKEA